MLALYVILVLFYLSGLLVAAVVWAIMMETIKNLKLPYAFILLSWIALGAFLIMPFINKK